MQQQVIFPDVEAALVAALDEGLTAAGFDVPVRTVVPKPRPASFVRVERLGGTRRSRVVDQALMTVEAWGADHETTSDLMQRARAIVFALEGSRTAAAMFYDVIEIAGPGYLPDAESAQPRFVWQVQLAVRGNPG